MTADAVQTVARGPRAVAEAAAVAIDQDPVTESLTYSILEEDEARDIWRIDAFPNTDDEQAALVAVLNRFPGLRVVTDKLADADWLAMALSGLPPVRAGRFFVYGAHDKGLVPLSAVALRIEAGAAFGTGHHGTTEGCLSAYDALIKARRFNRVLDVGCGSGVLAIAAAKTGSRIALGTDIDGPSVRIANENAALNRAPAARFVHASGLNDRRVRAAVPYVAGYPPRAEARRRGHPVRPASHPGAARAGGLCVQGLPADAAPAPRRLGDARPAAGRIGGARRPLQGAVAI